MKVLGTLILLCSPDLFAQDHEEMGGHFATEYVVGAMAHSDHDHETNVQPIFLQRAMKIGICPPIFGGYGGVCFDPVELFRPMVQLLRKPSPTKLKAYNSGTTAPSRYLPAEKPKQEAANKTRLTITCPGGMKIEILRESVSNEELKDLTKICSEKEERFASR